MSHEGKFPRDIAKEINIKFTLSNPLPDSFSPRNLLGKNCLLIWEDNKNTKILKTNDTSINVFKNLDKFINKIHALDIHIESLTYMGCQMNIVESPFIYRLKIVEKNNIDSYIIHNKEYKEMSMTKLIKSTVFIKEIDNTIIKNICKELKASFYDKLITILCNKLCKDISMIIIGYL